MLTETATPGTDDWWLMQLASDFGADLPRLHELKSHFDGTNALPDDVDAGVRVAYQRFLRLSRLNMAELIVTARTNRMKPLGFRTAAPGDDIGDAAAWTMWKRNGMKVGARDFTIDAGIYGSAYLTTTGPSTPDPSAQPLIIRSNGFTTVTRQSVLSPMLAEAALTVGWDLISGADVLTLFRPGYMRQAVRGARTSSVPSNGTVWSPGRGWSWVSDPIPLGYTADVPVFRLAGQGDKGMFEKHIDSLQRISTTIRERLTITAMQAFRQRAIKGDLPDVYPPDDLRAGQKINYEEIFRAGPAALWRLPTGLDLWESTPTDISAILTATKDDTRHLAAATSTPLYILSPDAANGSAEGASLAREALTFSVEDWIDRAEIPITRALGTGFAAQGDPVRAAVGDIEIIWAPADRSSIIERSMAASQAKTGGLSQRMINEKIFQLTPSEMQQEEQNKSNEAFAAAVSGG
ncbi:MAG: hypothetical protein J0H96_11865 [Microbacterium ginsengisoli]|jgi:hypothetical protein|nr:hypothetical protein [Microbacterium ginsengisoli]